MEYLHRIFDQEEYSNNEFIADQEIEVIMDIASFIAGRDLQEGDEIRISRKYISDSKGYYIIFWDGVRKGVMYSGFDFNKVPRHEEPAKWLMFYVPDPFR